MLGLGSIAELPISALPGQIAGPPAVDPGTFAMVAQDAFAPGLAEGQNFAPGLAEGQAFAPGLVQAEGN